jgi:hypothetical protein
MAPFSGTGVNGRETNRPPVGGKAIAMTTYEPRTPHTDAIKRPVCSKCGAVTRLFGIEPEKPGFELHTFACPKCQLIETAVAEIP